MKIISLDIGIKNMAICLFQSVNDNENDDNTIHFEIKTWDLINLTEATDQPICQCIEKKTNNPCQKPAKYRKIHNGIAVAVCSDSFFCLKHSKKHENMILPKPELSIPFLKKQRFQVVQDIAAQHGITSTQTSPKKADLLVLLEEYIKEKCFQEIVEKNASKLDLLSIGKNMKQKFDRIFLQEGKIDHVIIENQIADRMKTVQGMVLQYFLMNDMTENIEFISASNKLKDDEMMTPATSTTTTYGERKKMGITKCLEMLRNNPFFMNQVEFFINHQKKDDLADCFLQGMWFIRKKIN